MPDFWSFVRATAKLMTRLIGTAKLDIQRTFHVLIRRASLHEQLLAMQYIASI